MAKGSRRKGREAENEVADLVGGARISAPGLPGPDVETPDGTMWEVKKRKQTPGWLYDFVDQAVREGAEGKVFYRSNYKPWLVIMPLDVFLEHYERKTFNE